MTTGLATQEPVSYELFQEIAGELCEPIDAELTCYVRYELYTSKIVYLRHLYNEALRELNTSPSPRVSMEDLVRIQQCLAITDAFMRDTIWESLQGALERVTARQSVR